MNIVVDGLMVNYQKTGTGKKTIVCLPGWGDTAMSFSKLVEELQIEFVRRELLWLVLALPSETV